MTCSNPNLIVILKQVIAEIASYHNDIRIRRKYHNSADSCIACAIRGTHKKEAVCLFVITKQLRQLLFAVGAYSPG